MADTAALPFLAPGRIGRLSLANRLVRASTSETMATEAGAATPELERLYRDLARGGAGLILTGHIFVTPEGQYEPRQLGLDRDERVGPLRRVTDAVHAEGGRIFAELSHAGSQSIIPAIEPLSPSPVPNACRLARPAHSMRTASGASSTVSGRRRTGQSRPASTASIFIRATATCSPSSTRR